MTPLILLPGLLHDHRLWTHQAAALADIATISVPDLTQDDHLDAMAMRVLANAPARFALAGLSMGGYVAMAIHRLAPERVERLALLDTTARPDTPEQTERRLEAIRVAKAGGFSKIMPSMLPMLVHPDRLRDEAITGLAKEMAAAVGPDGFERQQTAWCSPPSATRNTCPLDILRSITLHT